MKKILILWMIGMAFMTLSGQECPLKVQFFVKDANCYNHGKICYCILDDSNNPVTNLSGTGLSNVRAYYKEGEEDAPQYAADYYLGGVDTISLEHGTYFFGIEADCSDGMGGTVAVDTMTSLTIRLTNEARLYDDVCQSQSMSYDDIYHVVSGGVASQSALNDAVKSAGTYVYTKTFPNASVYGCDSIVTFILTVNPPLPKETTVVTSNFELNGNPYMWRGHDMDATGRYSEVFSTPNECDSLDILKLVILNIDTTKNDICRGETTTMGLTVKTPELTWLVDETPNVMAAGDVLCSDGSVIRVDSFLHTSKTPIGVVYYVDRTGEHGKAVALVDAPRQLKWAGKGHSTAYPNIYKYIHSVALNDGQKDALFDLDGYGNTKEMIRCASVTGVEDSVWDKTPAAFYCFYYNPTDNSVDSTRQKTYNWYLPALGELNLVFGNRVEVNNTLIQLSSRYTAAPLSLEQAYYVSSSEKNESNCWRIDYSGHFVAQTKNTIYYVRPSINF